MSTARIHDLLIAGGGIAGAALAALLAPEGLDILVVDGAALDARLPEEATGVLGVDPRVVALNAASRALLDRAGAWARIAPGARCAYTQMRVWEQDGSASIGFDAAELGAAELGHIVENRWVVGALLGALAGQRNVGLRAATRVVSLAMPRTDGEPVAVGLSSGECLRARLVIGADGAASAVRALAAIPAEQVDTGQTAIVATIRSAGSHQHTAWQRFLLSGPLALLPLSAPPLPHCCSIVWSAEHAEARRLLALADAAFAAELGCAAEYCTGAVEQVSPRLSFPLRQQHAARYSVPGVALVGDAAHVVHPLAGQGINLGLADVRVLAEELVRGLRRGDLPGEPGALARYARRRRGENALMLEAMSGFRQLFGSRRVPVRLARSLGVALVDRMAPLKHEFMRRAMGVG